MSQPGHISFINKILGVYATQEEALSREVAYHHRFKVHLHAAFLNRASQTSERFAADNRDTIQTAESNLRRRETQLGRPKHTPESRAAIASYQRDQRQRSGEELKTLSDATHARNEQTVTCPYCGKHGQFTAMKRWHFANCKKAPNTSEKALQQREELAQRMRELNKKRTKGLEE